MSTLPHPSAPAETLDLNVTVTDPEVIAEVAARPEGRRRDDFVRSALRIGILALKQAEGRVDADVVRHEGERLIATLGAALAGHQKEVAGQIAAVLKDYFDPHGGRFNERVQRLVKEDGEIEQLLRRQVGGVDSELVRTLSRHVGADSPLLKMLSPDMSKGVLALLDQAVKKALDDQREAILGQFSLNNKDGALSRLVGELTGKHGDLEKNLKERIDGLVKEFSLHDKESSLSRMKEELLVLLEKQARASQDFQGEVKAALEGMKARRTESERSTSHGQDFEAALAEWLQADCRKTGDIFQNPSQGTGLISKCKVGDFVVVLGPDSRAAGAGIVVEAKASGEYDLTSALAEIDVARKNRGCAVGVFAWSRKSAPAGLPPLARFGDDVVVLWDSESEATDAYLSAGLSLARALCTRASVARDHQAADFVAIERAIREIEKQAASLDEIRTAAGTIDNGAKRILDRVRIAQEALGKQARALDALFSDLKS